MAIEARPDAVWLRSAAPLRSLASAVVGGGLARTRHVVNMHVPKDYDGRDPRADLRAFARRLGIAGPFVGLMTAAWTEEAQVVAEAAAGVALTVVATVGLGGAAAAGLSPVAPRAPSTINLIAVLDATLGRAAAVNAVITVTEAKAGALGAAGVLTPDGLPATGTVTDAVVVLWTGRGPIVPYLGPGTAVGGALARATRRALAPGIAARGGRRG